MHRVLRLIIAFLLAAAVPLQGIAAATMTACGPGHAAPSADSVSHHQGSSHPRAGHAMHHDQSTAFDEGDRFTAHAAHAGPDKQPPSKCSVCASCCAAAAMPSPSIVFGSVALMEFFAPSVSIGVPAFLTAGLERPPRLLRA